MKVAIALFLSIILFSSMSFAKTEEIETSNQQLLDYLRAANKTGSDKILDRALNVAQQAGIIPSAFGGRAYQLATERLIKRAESNPNGVLKFTLSARKTAQYREDLENLVTNPKAPKKEVKSGLDNEKFRELAEMTAKNRCLGRLKSDRNAKALSGMLSYIMSHGECKKIVGFGDSKRPRSDCPVQIDNIVTFNGYGPITVHTSEGRKTVQLGHSREKVSFWENATGGDLGRALTHGHPHQKGLIQQLKRQGICDLTKHFPGTGEGLEPAQARFEKLWNPCSDGSKLGDGGVGRCADGTRPIGRLNSPNIDAAAGWTAETKAAGK